MPVCARILLSALLVVCPSATMWGAITLHVDLNRNLPEIQTQMANPPGMVIKGQVLIDVPQNETRLEFLNTMSLTLELAPGSNMGEFNFIQSGCRVQPGLLGLDSVFNQLNMSVNPALIGITQIQTSGNRAGIPAGAERFVLFLFDLKLGALPSERINVSFRRSFQDGFTNMDEEAIFVSDPDVAANGAVIENLPAGGDTGLYVLDVYGGRHAVGFPEILTGPLYFGADIARAMTRNWKSFRWRATDLLVLESNGIAHRVVMQESQPAQPPEGVGEGAIDVEYSADGTSFWALTETGLLYDHNGAVILEIPDIGPDVPVPGRYGLMIPDYRESGLEPGPMPHPLPPGGPWDASLRAVDLEVYDENQNGILEAPTDGFMILLSNGDLHRFHRTPAGDFATVYPFELSNILDPGPYPGPSFPGLDIARDVEITPGQNQAVILDGWGGLHSIPPNPDAQSFLGAIFGPENTKRNMPYLVIGFDNPLTPFDESDALLYGLDANSIFINLEFSSFGEPGFYTLDRFGRLKASGGARIYSDVPQTRFNETPYLSDEPPYWYPYLTAVDLTVHDYRLAQAIPGTPAPTFTPGPVLTATATPTRTPAPNTPTPIQPASTNTPTNTRTYTPTNTAVPSPTATESGFGVILPLKGRAAALLTDLLLGY